MPETPGSDGQRQRNLDAVARFSCPFCGAQRGTGCKRVEATYSPPLPALVQPHVSRLRLLDGEQE